MGLMLMTTGLLSLLVFLLFLLVSVQLSSSQPSADFIVGEGTVNPWDMCVDPTNGDLWVADTGSNRLLRFTERNGFSAPVTVLGQPGPNDTTLSSPNAASLNSPQGVVIDKFGTLWVTDTINSRVLWYLRVSTKLNGSNADGVLGQVNFSSVDTGPNGNMFRDPCGLHVDSNGTLWVADQYNQRVLRFVNVLEKATNQEVIFADSVLGQSGFGSSDFGCCASCMQAPAAVVTTARGDLIVVDQYYRVLYFTAGDAVLNDSAASWVILQQAFNSCDPEPPTAATTGGLTGPNGVAVDPVGNLYVSDNSYNRVLMFQGGAYPSKNGMSASFVYGQPDFVSTTPGSDPNQLSAPLRLYFDTIRNVLWVADEGNARVVGYKTFISSSSPNLDLQVAFQGSSPSFVLYPKGLNGTIYPNTFQTSFQPLFIEERDGPFSTTVVQNVTFPLTGYTAASAVNAFGTQFFDFSISLNSTTVGFEYALFETPQQIESAGVQFDVPASSLKFTFKMSGWQCVSPRGSLHVYFSLTTIPAISTSVIKPDPSNSNLDDLVVNSTGQMTTTVRLLKYAVVDGVNTPVIFRFDDGNLVLQFPCFNHSLIYDPDFSVVLGEANEEEVSDGGGGTPLVAIVLPVVLVPMAVLVVAGVILLALLSVAIRKKKQLQRAQLAAVNF